MIEIKHKVATGLILWLMKKRGFYGWTSSWNTIYYQSEELLKNDRLRRHELVHIEQMQREGKIMFMFNYLIENIRVGYKNNKYEFEARKKSEVM